MTDTGGAAALHEGCGPDLLACPALPDREPATANNA